MNRATVAVFPRAELERRKLLFGALEAAFPVRFDGRTVESGFGDADAVIELGGAKRASEANEAGLPSLALLLPEPAAGNRTEAEQKLAAVAAAGELDERLRGATLPDERLGAAPPDTASLTEAAAATVLAEAAGRPTWVKAGPFETALLIPEELLEDEALRERLCLKRSAALLPLVHFLRRQTAAIGWQPPAARATLLFDDPNLHWPSYGFVKLRELAGHARLHGYHVALATVPLDTWFAHPSAIRALRESSGSISLHVHGNDHNGGELGDPETDEEGVAMAAQALRRIDAFRARRGVEIEQVMAPPHERCSRAAVSGLRRCGFDAITMTRPFPWLSRPPRSWLAHPAAAGPLVGWQPADFADGMPVILRHPLVERDAPELVLRSFLDQPLILYGHHGDVSGGLAPLAAAAEEVNRLRETRWCSVGAIAASNYETKLEGTRLRLRPFSRRIEVELPEGVEELAVELPPSHPDAESEELIVAGTAAEFTVPLAASGGGRVEIELRAVDRVDPASVAGPGPQPLAVARRLLGEGRDRLLPLLARGR
jgi:hypothetical protein